MQNDLIIYLVDEIFNFEELIEYIIKDNNFNDYKIYENKVSGSFFENFLVNYIYKNNSYSNDNICKKLKTTINVVIPTFLEKC